MRVVSSLLLFNIINFKYPVMLFATHSFIKNIKSFHTGKFTSSKFTTFSVLLAVPTTPLSLAVSVVVLLIGLKPKSITGGFLI